MVKKYIFLNDAGALKVFFYLILYSSHKNLAYVT